MRERRVGTARDEAGSTFAVISYPLSVLKHLRCSLSNCPSRKLGQDRRLVLPAEAASLETASATGNRLPRFSSKDKSLVYTTFAAEELGLWANDAEGRADG